MRQSLMIAFCALSLTACGGAREPSDKDALTALRHGTFEGDLGEELGRFAFIDANVIACESGKRGDQAVALCDVCVILAGNEFNSRRTDGGTATTNRLVAGRVALRTTFTHALSLDNPDVAPDKTGGGVWVSSSTLANSTAYHPIFREGEADGGYIFLSDALMTRLNYPRTRAFAGLDEYRPMLRQLEGSDVTRSVLAETGRCEARKGSGMVDARGRLVAPD